MVADIQSSARDVDLFLYALVVNNLSMEGSMWWTSHDGDVVLRICVGEGSP
jgi:hypothetical protein